MSFFPDFLYQLSARDQAGPLLEIVHRARQVTDASNVIAASSMYVVPEQKIFILRQVSCVALAVAAATTQRDLVLALSIGTSSTSEYFGQGKTGPLIGTGGGVMITMEDMMLPPKSVVALIQYASGAVAATDWQFSLHGYNIPVGNIGTSA